MARVLDDDRSLTGDRPRLMVVPDVEHCGRCGDTGWYGGEARSCDCRAGVERDQWLHPPGSHSRWYGLPGWTF